MELRREFENRIKVSNNKSFNNNGKYIVYWMNHSHRAYFNHSLEFAIELANIYQKPLLVYFPITDKYRFSNVRYYKFMLDGILEAKKAIEERGIKFILEKVDDMKQKILEISKSSFALILDKAYLRYYRNLHKKIADGIDISVFEVESVNLDFGIKELTINNSLEILNTLNINKNISISPFVGGYSNAKNYLENF